MESPRSALVGLLFSIIALVIFVFACQSTKKSTELAQKVGIMDVVNYYRDFDLGTADGYWKGRKIEVNLVGLPQETYQVEGNRILYYTGLKNAPPIVAFICIEPLTDNKRSIVVVGWVKGIVKDGINRGKRVDFVLEVEGCTVSIK
jgi:hypothetical protein